MVSTMSGFLNDPARPGGLNDFRSIRFALDGDETSISEGAASMVGAGDSISVSVEEMNSAAASSISGSGRGMDSISSRKDSGA
jgi:hypothetical protein